MHQGVDELPYKSARASNADKPSFAASIRGKVNQTRNPEIKHSLIPVTARHAKASSDLLHPGQLETTEEVLRKHYFMAKATNKTQHDILEKQVSPQKHLIKAKYNKKGQDEKTQGHLNKVRGENIDELQTQAASLMRLNATWGLESKGPQVDRLRARVSAEEADQGGVFTNVLEDVTQMPAEI